MLAAPLPVVVVGLGPVGGVLAALLGAAGVRVVVLERDAAPHSTPRAAHLDGEALRVLAAAGVETAGLGRPLDGFDLVDRRGRLLLRGRPAQAAPPGFPAGVLMYQPDVERALRRRLAALPTVDVRLGHAVESIRERGGPQTGGPQTGESITVSGVGPGGAFAVEAALVVGCDGASSRVREAAGVALAGGGFEQAWLVVDALVDRPARERLPRRLLQIADPARPSTYVPFPDPRRRWEFRLRPGEDADIMCRPASVRALLAPHVDPDAAEVERAAVYTFHNLVAERWRAGRVVLAGDAAHQMPPFLGQGLGAGLRDAWALAPLAAAVAQGGAALGTLDAYEAERRPHVEATVRQAVRLGRLVTLPAPLAAVRDAVLRAGWRVPSVRRRLLDVRG
ncbi:bifunctional 3-(3-hydroxy-phenyl)propionate/3-hydroxycinnamic acid hydroxylase [Rubrivirga litoralis]|uniref:Bifunctional 3-(3-hydroxy-phenyl)propionate/3-hydroxycinnamic acid hydroxylase n=1 Tax=Rubrivirga litoralis TaxID=3075598 RepID=A0ABU3BRU3_9BACT|nr:bifunctional 3-(3-hydroxy-phenyl)propionate/3-hydroxycinnamic acid hydroxylase [Rubrivirga sp. F394]MDT0632010.1 bifunctional 3-(3-hydroxy-phenyl)propionate/3-hydroxycinnamic acid hydroxylase [Rubrivirga sp. F394]